MLFRYAQGYSSLCSKSHSLVVKLPVKKISYKKKLRLLDTTFYIGKEVHVLYLEGRHMGGGTQGRISMLFFQDFVWALVTIMLTRQCQDSLYFGRLKALHPICLPSVYLTLLHVTISPGPSVSIFA